MSWEQIADFTIRSKLAKDHGLGPYKKKAPATKAVKEEQEKNATTGGGDSANSLQASIPVDTEEPIQSAPATIQVSSQLLEVPIQTLPESSTFDAQSQFHEQALQDTKITLSKDDLYTAISKSNSLIYSAKSKPFLMYWKIK